MKKLSVLLVLFIMSAALVVAGMLWWRSAVEAPGTEESQVRFVIPRGSSAAQIGNNLEEAGLIKSALAFKFYIQINSLSKNIPPGEFNIPRNLSLEELVEYILKGPSELWVTIPEGLRREEVALRVADQLGRADRDAFYSEFMAASAGHEGYLFPDTYLFPPTASAAAVVNRLLSTFESKFESQIAPKLASSGLSRGDVVIMASLIEREALSSAERPYIAGILFNRLEAGWPLQVDATAQYALASARCAGQIDCTWWAPPTRADLQVDSPYNTYVVTGLPPAPIASPGLTSLLAVVEPAQSNYMFYIHDKSGTIHYAETLDQHNVNVSKYLR